jgi:hypothetical protein
MAWRWSGELYSGTAFLLLDEFKGAWRALQSLAPDRLNLLRKVAAVESVGSSTRIEGAKLTDGEVERLLSGIGLKHFRSRDEQEVAGYAEAMNLVFDSYSDIPPVEVLVQGRAAPGRV